MATASASDKALMFMETVVVVGGCGLAMNVGCLASSKLRSDERALAT